MKQSGCGLRARFRAPAARIWQAGPASAVLLGVAVTFASAAAETPTAASAERAGATAAGPRAVTPRPFGGLSLYVDPGNPAARQAAEWQRSRPAEARLMAAIAAEPVAAWFGDWNRNVRTDVERLTKAAAAAGAVPVLVAYNIPARDCGSYSAGGTRDGAAYRRWIREFAAGLGERPAVVVLEPDALASTECLDATRKRQRFELLRDAVAVLKAKGGTSVYLDAGHARWLGVTEAAARLRQAGIARADGFALNVSNYVVTSENVQYGKRLAAAVGGKHFVIDTSRNGRGAASGNEWCNPADRALGERPSTQTGEPLVDAYLWIKRPGESDGTCNGGPRAGAWWPEYALGLAQRSPVLLAAGN